MKVIFLDVDGVLNHRRWIQDNCAVDRMHALDPECLRRLAQIVRVTKAHIVVSSTWRLGITSLLALKDQLESHGMFIYSTTPDSPTGVRHKEIQTWLDCNSQVEAFAILDDDRDADVGHSFFRTKFDSGLTDEIAEEVIRHLNPK